jgi:hypothetical protein
MTMVKQPFHKPNPAVDGTAAEPRAISPIAPVEKRCGATVALSIDSQIFTACQF